MERSATSHVAIAWKIRLKMRESWNDGANNVRAHQAPRPEILFIEGDPQIRQSLGAILATEDYGVYAVTGDEAVHLAASGRSDLILLDLDTPGAGIELIQRLRSLSQVPIVALSARMSARDSIEVLDVGADHYLSKPFGSAEFLARIRAVLRRAAVLGRDVVVGNIHVNIVTRRVTVEGSVVHLTPIEFKLLQVLLRYTDQVVTQQQLLGEVWGPLGFGPQRLRVYMRQLRQKLEIDPSHPRHFITAQGVGYCLLSHTSDDVVFLE